MDEQTGFDVPVRIGWGDVERWETLLRTLPIAMIATDAMGTVRVWNHHAAAVYGWAPEEATGRRIQELTVGPQDQTLAGDIMARVGSGAVWEGEFTAATRAGGTVDIHVINAPVLDDAGVLAGLLGLSVDVSVSRHELRRDLKQVRDASLRALVDVEVARARIAEQLHDQLGQTLTAMRSELLWLAERPEDDRAAILGRLHELVESGIENVRRVCEDLRPRLLHELGLEESIDIMARASAGRIGAESELSVEVVPLLAPFAALALFHTAQECFTNVERHAATSAQIAVTFGVSPHSVHLGEPVVVLQVGCDGGEYRGEQGYGISAMRNRIGALGGVVLFEAQPGGGLVVRIELPAAVALAPPAGPDDPVQVRTDTGLAWQ